MKQSNKGNKDLKGVIYLIHFEKPLADHASHYLGWTEDLEARNDKHRLGGGAKILRAATEAGIAWNVVKTWVGTLNDERAIKRQHNLKRFCPECEGKTVEPLGGKISGSSLWPLMTATLGGGVTLMASDDLAVTQLQNYEYPKRRADLIIYDETAHVSPDHYKAIASACQVEFIPGVAQSTAPESVAEPSAAVRACHWCNGHGVDPCADHRTQVEECPVCLGKGHKN